MRTQALLVGMTFMWPAGGEGAQEHTTPIVERFDRGWEARWMVRKLNGRLNRHESDEDRGNSTLRIDSAGGASALWRSILFHPVRGSRIAWRWKIERALGGAKVETQREGDDYAARLFVIFDPVLFNLQMRAICYVWAANEPEGRVFPNPFSENVATIVLRTGNTRAGQWVAEDRDVVEDFTDFFGESPEMVTALALMADTDNTNDTARAWFDDIELATR